LGLVDHFSRRPEIPGRLGQCRLQYHGARKIIPGANALEDDDRSVDVALGACGIVRF
jgi:hypothetical protein